MPAHYARHLARYRSRRASANIRCVHGLTLPMNAERSKMIRPVVQWSARDATGGASASARIKGYLDTRKVPWGAVIGHVPSAAAAPLVGEGGRQAQRHRAPHPHRRPVDASGRPPGAPGARTRRPSGSVGQGGRSPPCTTDTASQGRARVEGRRPAGGLALAPGRLRAALAAAGAGLVELQAGDWQAPTMPAHYARHQPAGRGPRRRRQAPLSGRRVGAPPTPPPPGRRPGAARTFTLLETRARNTEALLGRARAGLMVVGGLACAGGT